MPISTVTNKPRHSADSGSEPDFDVSVVSQSAGRDSNRILIAVFVLFVAIFAVGSALNFPKTIDADEQREMAPAPRISLKRLGELPRQVDAFLADRMFARGPLIAVRNLLKMVCFDRSGCADVILGRDGWLFYIGEGSGELMSRKTKLSSAEVERWRNVLRFRTQWLAARGIRYVVVVAPDKQSVYPEFLKPGVARTEKSRLEKLSSALAATPGITFVNLAENIRDAKPRHDESLYFKTDTHWNDPGAFVAFQAISKVLGQWYPEVVAVQPPQFQQAKYKGDLALMLHLPDSFKENVRMRSAVEAARQRPVISKGVVLHDSFGTALNPLLSPVFKEVKFQRRNDMGIDLLMIENEKPDVVIQEIVERHAMTKPLETADWTLWALRTIARKEGAGAAVWLNVLPNSKSINLRKLSGIEEVDRCKILPTTSRLNSGKTESLSDDLSRVKDFHWYLLKTGDLEGEWSDEKSKANYLALQKHLQSSNAFELIDTLPLADGSSLKLMRRLALNSASSQTR